MERAANDQFEYSIATSPPTPRQRQMAFLIVIVTLAAFGAMIPKRPTLVLTTCHPKYSSRERLIVTATLVRGPEDL